MSVDNSNEVGVERFQVLLAKMYACRSESSALIISDKLTFIKKSMPEKEEVLAQLAHNMYWKLREHLSENLSQEDFILTEIKAWNLYWLLTRDMQLIIKGEKEPEAIVEQPEAESLHFGKVVLGAALASSVAGLIKFALKKQSVEAPSEVVNESL